MDKGNKITILCAIVGAVIGIIGGCICDIDALFFIGLIIMWTAGIVNLIRLDISGKNQKEAEEEEEASEPFVYKWYVNLENGEKRVFVSRGYHRNLSSVEDIIETLKDDFSSWLLNDPTSAPEFKEIQKHESDRNAYFFGAEFTAPAGTRLPDDYEEYSWTNRFPIR